MYMYEACVSFLASSSIIFPVIVGVGNVGEESTSSTRLLERAPRRGKVFSLELWVSQRRGKQSNTPSKCRKLSRISQYQNPPALSINLKYVLDRWGRFPDKKISDTFSIFSMIILVKFSLHLLMLWFQNVYKWTYAHHYWNPKDEHYGCVHNSHMKFHVDISAQRKALYRRYFHGWIFISATNNYIFVKHIFLFKHILTWCSS